MSFVWFRKHEKKFLWGAVVFAVVLLATFSGFGSLNKLLQRAGTDVEQGEFVVQSTGATMRVGVEEYQRVRTAMNRWAMLERGSGRDNVTEDEVWARIMLVADAHGAGLDVGEAELTKELSDFTKYINRGEPMTKEQYRNFWRDTLQFPSTHEFEGYISDQMLASHWAEVQRDETGIVSADDVYLKWRADNEVFDFEGLVFPDEPLDKIADPDAATVKAYWDGLSEPVRSGKFVDPARQDIVYAWLPLAGGAEKVPADKLATVPEPDPKDIEARWNMLKTERWPDKTELDDEVRGVLGQEIRLTHYVANVLSAFGALPEQTADAFSKHMTEAGLSVANPDGALGPDQLKALPDIGDENLPRFLAGKTAGSTYLGYPYGKQKSVYVVFVESVQPSRPLGFDEAHDQIVKAWKEEQVGRAAKDFRAQITAKARELPEAAQAIAPILEAAKLRAEQQAGDKTGLDEAELTALRQKILDDAEQTEVAPRLAEFESKVWANLTLPDGVKRIAFSGVRRSYARHPDAGEPADGIERFLKTNGAVFALAVNAISPPLHHGPSGKTAIVRVLGRSFPQKVDMPADRESMDASRKQLQAQLQYEAGKAFSPEALKLSHHLKVAEKLGPGHTPSLPDDGE